MISRFSSWGTALDSDIGRRLRRERFIAPVPCYLVHLAFQPIEHVDLEMFDLEIVDVTFDLVLCVTLQFEAEF